MNQKSINTQKVAILPKEGLVRLKQIVGYTDKETGEKIPGVIPIGKSTWWDGVKSGKYPKPVKLGPRCTCWNVEDIRRLIPQAS